MFYKSVSQECPTRVSHKSVLQECPTRVSQMSVLQECPTRVSYKSVPQECYKSVLQSVPQECPTRVSFGHISFSNVFAFGFVGSILFAPRGYIPLIRSSSNQTFDNGLSFTPRISLLKTDGQPGFRTPAEVLMYYVSHVDELLSSANACLMMFTKPTCRKLAA